MALDKTKSTKKKRQMKKSTKVTIKRWTMITIVALLVLSLLAPIFVSADELTEPIKGKPKPGDVIVTLGADLTPQQRTEVLNQFKVVEKTTPIVEVNINDEKKYLGKFISAERIGNETYSSAKIEILKEGEGVQVDTTNVTWVSEAMYANALITAGIKDAKVTVTSPYKVSGTGALTGAIKAYDQYEDVKISEENKQVANEELVTTAKLGDEVGKEDASIILTKIKDAAANNEIKTEADAKEVVVNITNDMNINLDAPTADQLTALAFKMSQLDVDWTQVGEQVDKLKEGALNIVESEQAKQVADQAKDTEKEAGGFFASVLEFFSSILDGIASIFK